MEIVVVMNSYYIKRSDGHLYRGTNGPDVWSTNDRREAMVVLAACNAFERGHRLVQERPVKKMEPHR